MESGRAGLWGYQSQLQSRKGAGSSGVSQSLHPERKIVLYSTVQYSTEASPDKILDQGSWIDLVHASSGGGEEFQSFHGIRAHPVPRRDGGDDVALSFGNAPRDE